MNKNKDTLENMQLPLLHLLYQACDNDWRTLLLVVAEVATRAASDDISARYVYNILFGTDRLDEVIFDK